MGARQLQSGVWWGEEIGTAVRRQQKGARGFALEVRSGGESRGWETGGAGWGGLELPARAFINYQFHRLYLTPATERADEFT